LKEVDADVNTMNICHNMALEAATSNGHESIIKLLIKANAKIGSMAWKGTKNYERVVKLLIKTDNNVNVNKSSKSVRCGVLHGRDMKV